MHWPTAFRGGDEKFPRDSETGRIVYGKALNSEAGEETAEVAAPVHFVETYEAMERLVRKGLVRSIGVSNFNESQIIDVLQMATYAPQVLQIEASSAQLYGLADLAAAEFACDVVHLQPYGQENFVWYRLARAQAAVLLPPQLSTLLA